MFVKPVSKAKVSITAMSVALRDRNRSSKVCRAAIAPHSLVWYALCAQSNCRSLLQ